jgi:hypothetical protein
MTGPAEFRGQELEDLAEPAIATRYLARLLVRGELALLLGAGVSMSNDLPSWKGLVRNCERSVGIALPSDDEDSDPRTAAQLLEAMEAVRVRVGSNDELLQLVQHSLYTPTQIGDGTYADGALQSMLLIAIGALVMPSARGSIRDVITLNFDDLLEWYLRLHGFSATSVTTFPTYLRSDYDVTVFHPHGFLPLVDNREATNWLVLRHSEFVARLARTSGEAWPNYLTSLFMTKRLLAIGSSMSDIDIEVHMAAAHKEHPGGGVPTGFVVGAKIDEAKQNQLLQAGLVPISLGHRDEVPAFILGICRQAAEFVERQRGGA